MGRTETARREGNARSRCGIEKNDERKKKGRWDEGDEGVKGTRHLAIYGKIDVLVYSHSARD